MDGPDGVGKVTRSAGRELPLSTAQGQGPGATVVGTRDHGKVRRWGSHRNQASMTEPAQWLSVAEGVDRWAEKLSVALTRSIADHHRHCPR